jgi:hypothetical protein
MYQNVGELAVREHLAAHDTERFATYASGNLTRSERLRINLEELGALFPLVGAVAVRGLGHTLIKRTELGSTGTYLGLALSETADRVTKKFSKIGKNREETLDRQSRVESQMNAVHQKARSKAVPPPVR